jgi:circadian clock protein KaiC
MTLVSGGPGAGKTVLSLEYVYRGALAGEPGMFVSFEEQAEAFRINARSLGWDLKKLEDAGKLLVMNPEPPAAGIVKTGAFDIRGLLAILTGRIKTLKSRRLVLDALDGLLRIFSDPEQQRDQLAVLHSWLTEQGLTCVFTVKADPQGHSIYPYLDYLADCVLFLDQRVNGQVSTRRLRVIKYRGSGFMSNEYPYVIDADGMTILPVSQVSLVHKGLGERLTSGSPVLDKLLGGGFRRSASIMLAGASGTGKTTLASMFAQAACQQGERVLYLNFEESREAMVASMLSPGIDLRPFLEEGVLEIRTTMPESRGVEEHLVRILNMMDTFHPRHLVVDAISACRRMGPERSVFDFLVRLLAACKARGITCLFINQTHTMDAYHKISGVGISSLIDTVVVVRYLEAAGEIQRSLLVLKSRGSYHSNRLHRLTISDQGAKLTELPVGSEPWMP